ncbi:hypothetical protein DRN85_08575 [Methanosarcinales archaeon]|nr:MAG: hypothetical protein DRN85_08575 [Methanosarcinales archaeon]
MNPTETSSSSFLPTGGIDEGGGEGQLETMEGEMKILKMNKIIKSCSECPWCVYLPFSASAMEPGLFLCRKVDRVILTEVSHRERTSLTSVPSWCPLPSISSPKLKLYVWNEVESLAQYGDGITFALAPDKESAIEAILRKYWKEVVETEVKRGSGTSLVDSYVKTYTSLSEELKAKEPLVVENIEGFWVYGTA